MKASDKTRSFLSLLRAGTAECHLGGRRVLLAVSGGADSVAMLRGLLALRNELALDLYAAHLNHNLRGAASAADAHWLTQLCRRLEIPLTVGSKHVADIAEGRQKGIEETARLVRYEFLTDEAQRLGCTHIAVAHTADDQAETILHHILRGTGVDGLCGIPRSRSLEQGPVLVRPLLGIKRDQVVEYLAEIRADFCSDASNVDERFTRSRIRGSLLPVLRERFNPQVDEALRRLGRQADEIRRLLDQLSARLLAECIEDKQRDVCRLNCEVLAHQPRHLVRECFKRLWKELDWPRQQMGFAEWDRLAGLALSDGAATLPGKVEARRRGKLLMLRRHVAED